jgi:hypothetical protein
VPKFVSVAEVGLLCRQRALRYSLIRPPTVCLRSIRAVISMILAGLALWRQLAACLVRPVAVVMPRILGQDRPEVLLTGDQQMIEALATQRADKPFRE